MRITEELFNEYGYDDENYYIPTSWKPHDPIECKLCGELIKKGSKVRFKCGEGLSHVKCIKEYISSLQ